MQLRVTRIDATLPLPKYETDGACAFDLIARETTIIEPKAVGRIPSNVIVCVPKGYVLLVTPRSSTPKKKGLLIPHGTGVIDQDYRGPTDEIFVQLWNFTDAATTVERGERFAQAMIVPVLRCELVEGVPAAEKSRGGFGSTG